MYPTRPVNSRLYGKASKIRQIHRMNSWVMFAGPPSLLMTRRPSSCMPNVCPWCECGLTTQYQMLIRMNSAAKMIPPMMWMLVRLLMSNGIDTRPGMSQTRKVVDQVLDDAASGDPGLCVVDRADRARPPAVLLAGLLVALVLVLLALVAVALLALLALVGPRLARDAAAGRLAIALLAGHRALLAAAPLARLVPLRHAHLIPRSTPAMKTFCGSFLSGYR